MSAERPKYSSPVKNLRAARAAAAELSSLSGDALRRQQARVNELLSAANEQNEAYRKANPGAGGSQVLMSGRNDAGKSVGQASSPNASKRRAGSVNSGKNK